MNYIFCNNSKTLPGSLAELNEIYQPQLHQRLQSKKKDLQC